MAAVSDELRVSWWDRFLIGIAPDWGLRRVRARATAEAFTRHFEAAQGSRRTTNWSKSASDANVANRPALASLRELSRDLRRNNGWAKRGIQTIVNNTVGWGIVPKATGTKGRAKQALEIWNEWANSTACDYDGRLNFYGIQRLAMECIAESGEVLIVKQPAASVDGLPIPLRLHVLEPDYLDLSRNGIIGEGGGPTYNGVEFDKFGRRVAYWLFTSHPGGLRLQTTQFYSVRVPAERVLHVYRVDRPGQIRGVPWMAPAIVRLKDFDDFEDAELMQQKVAACFAAFVTDLDGSAPRVGLDAGTDDDGSQLEQLEPGHIEYMPPGKDVKFAQPPAAQNGAFSTRALRRFAVSLGVPYEAVSGDYSQVNYSSARMGRIELRQNVNEWREHMLLPQLCTPVWCWAMELVAALEGWPEIPGADWACPPMSILEPDKEALAYTRMIRAGLMTWAQAVRELGYDPRDQLEEIEEYNELIDEAEIVLDSDPRHTNAAGQMQQLPAAPGSDGGDAKDADKKDAGADDGTGGGDDDATDRATH